MKGSAHRRETSTGDQGDSAVSPGSRTGLAVVNGGSRRDVFVVLSPYASDASLLGEVLQILGVDVIGQDRSDAESSPLRDELAAIQQSVLAEIGRGTDRPEHLSEFPSAWWRRRGAQTGKKALAEFIRSQLERTPAALAFMDPRTCRLLPLWFEVLGEIGVRAHFIHVLAPPAVPENRTIESGDLPIASGALSELAWLAYTYDVVRYFWDAGDPFILDPSDWSSNPFEVLARIVAGTNLPASPTWDEQIEAALHMVQEDARSVPFEDGQSSDGRVGTALFFERLVDAARAGRVTRRALKQELSIARGLLGFAQPFARAIEESEAILRQVLEEPGEGEGGEAQLRHRRARLLRMLSGASEQGVDAADHAAAELDDDEDFPEGEVESLDDTAAGQPADPGGEWHTQAPLVPAFEDARRYVGQRQAAIEAALQTATASAADAQAELAGANRALSAAEERERNLLLANARLERELSAALKAGQTGLTELASGAYPAETGDEDVAAGLSYSGLSGFGGCVDAPGAGDRPPLIEVRVDGTLALLKQCRVIPGGENFEFAVRWEEFASAFLGRNATLHIAGNPASFAEVEILGIGALGASPEALIAAGIGGTAQQAASYLKWIETTETAADAEEAKAYYKELEADLPVVRFVLFGDDQSDLHGTIASLREQFVANWEAICVDLGEGVLEPDARIRQVARADLPRALADYPPNALFSFVQYGDVIAPVASGMLAKFALDVPGFALVYSDEDVLLPEWGLRGLPHMKGAWSPDLALGQDYMVRLCMVRRRALPTDFEPGATSLYALALAAGLSGEGVVEHLPFVLYHRAVSNVPPPETLRPAVEEAVGRMEGESLPAVEADLSRGWRVDWPVPAPEPRVSLIVPTRDRVDLLRGCVDGFLYRTRYSDLEVIIADNESSEPETLSYLSAVASDPRVKVIKCEGEFNFSAINNEAARAATGSMIGLMNNDLLVIHPDWLSRMVALASREGTGMVGAKLLYADDRIQHAGITLGIGIASHLYKLHDGAARGHHDQLLQTRDLSAVTAACLLMPRSVWEEVEGLDETFPVAYNDVDLCLKVGASGHRVIWTPDALLYHLESQSRGYERSAEKRERLAEDKARLTEKWGERLVEDPFYSPNLSVRDTDASLAFPSRAARPWLSRKKT